MTNSETGSFDHFLTNLIEGQHVLVDTGDIPSEKPTWYDEHKFQDGKNFVEKYYGGVLMAHLTSLIMLLYSPRVLKPLIFTGKSETPRKSYRRYIATTVHIMSWYRGNIWQEGSLARQSLQQVRKLHSDAALSMNSPGTKSKVERTDISQCGPPLDGGCPLAAAIRQDFSAMEDSSFQHLFHPKYYRFNDESSENDIPYFNQLDMSGTQFAFMGLIVLFPKKFGLGRATDSELEGFLHFWRCIGYLLGIEDRFNFCSMEDLPSARAWTRFFLEQVVKPSLKVMVTPEYEHMGRAVALGARNYQFSTYESSYLFVAHVIETDLPEVKKRISLADRARFYFKVFLFGFVGNLYFGHRIINHMVQTVVTMIVSPSSYPNRKMKPPPVSGLEQLWNNPT